MNEDLKQQLAALLAVVFGGALIFALAAEAPDEPPTWALQNDAVYRLEVALALFLLLYVPIAAIALARQGRLFTKLTAGPASAEAEDAVADAADENAAAIAELKNGLDRVVGISGTALQAVTVLGQRVTKLEAQAGHEE